MSKLVLRQAQDLIAHGKWQDAFILLDAANRRSPNAALERCLIDVLLRAAQSTSTPAQETDTPAISKTTPTKLLCGAGEIPAVAAAELNPGILREAIQHHGYLIVRGLLTEPDAASLRVCIDESLRARVEAHDHGAIPSPESPWYYPSPHFPGNHVAYANRNSPKKFSTTGSMPVADSPRGTFRVLDVYRKLGLQRLLATYFSEPAVIATRKWIFRLVAPRPDADNGIGGGWHQDGQFMGESIRTINLWVALSPCGDTTAAPSIAIIPKRLHEVVEFGTHGATLDWTVGPQLVEKIARDAPMLRPRFNTGDALFFDHLSLHRTGHAAGQTQQRYALESWFYARSASSTRPVMPLY